MQLQIHERGAMQSRFDAERRALAAQLQQVCCVCWHAHGWENAAVAA
jgi:hypothetical protein